ncbi:MAG: TlpA family protein disulfide reductase [Gemmobacter sp.]
MMRLSVAMLYTALMLGANPGAADVAAAAAARAGDMRKLVFHEVPQPIPDAALLGLDEAPRSLSEWRGKWVVVNFWATWCAPCRTEMPALDRLAAGGTTVVTVATGRNPVPAIERFWSETGITHLPVLRDPSSELSRGMAIFGLPVTIILNPEGQEVARLVGDAAWDAPEAKAVLEALAR